MDCRRVKQYAPKRVSIHLCGAGFPACRVSEVGWKACPTSPSRGLSRVNEWHRKRTIGSSRGKSHACVRPGALLGLPLYVSRVLWFDTNTRSNGQLDGHCLPITLPSPARGGVKLVVRFPSSVTYSRFAFRFGPPMGFRPPDGVSPRTPSFAASTPSHGALVPQELRTYTTVFLLWTSKCRCSQIPNASFLCGDTFPFNDPAPDRISRSVHHPGSRSSRQALEQNTPQGQDCA
jgi:hypothetical protein